MSEGSDYDSPWKEAWRIYLHSFMRLCFGQVETAIDWRRPPEFLDKELQKLTRQSESGKQFVDMLIKVWLLNGSAEWILLHVEVQHRHRPDPVPTPSSKRDFIGTITEPWTCMESQWARWPPWRIWTRIGVPITTRWRFRGHGCGLTFRYASC